MNTEKRGVKGLQREGMSYRLREHFKLKIGEKMMVQNLRGKLIARKNNNFRGKMKEQFSASGTTDSTFVDLKASALLLRVGRKNI